VASIFFFLVVLIEKKPMFEEGTVKETSKIKVYEHPLRIEIRLEESSVHVDIKLIFLEKRLSNVAHEFPTK
jgi:hypothetical protein